MKIEIKSINEIYPYPNNPRKNDKAVDAVAESIKQCGYISPIIIDEDGIILAGHTRYKALKKLGINDIEVIVKNGLSEDQKKKYRLLDNKTGEIAEWDYEMLEYEISQIENLDFGELKIDWGIKQPIELEEMEDVNNEIKITSYKCPKCGFVFEVDR